MQSTCILLQPTSYTFTSVGIPSIISSLSINPSFYWVIHLSQIFVHVIQVRRFHLPVFCSMLWALDSKSYYSVPSYWLRIGHVMQACQIRITLRNFASLTEKIVPIFMITFPLERGAIISSCLGIPLCAWKWSKI